MKTVINALIAIAKAIRTLVEVAESQNGHNSDYASNGYDEVDKSMKKVIKDLENA